MTLPRAQHPFQFVTRVNLIELMGLKARTLQELATILKTVPGSVVYHHTHHFLKQHHFLSPEPPNDFAYWASNVLNDNHLGEQLASIDTVQFGSIRELRDKIVRVIEQYVAKFPSLMAPVGQEFHFMKSISFVLPTSYRVNTLAEFVEAVQKVSIYSLYHHIFESRLRLEKSTNDFSRWLEVELGEKALARAIAQMDPYTQTLESLRGRIVRLGMDRLRVIEREGAHVA